MFKNSKRKKNFQKMKKDMRELYKIRPDVESWYTGTNLDVNGNKMTSSEYDKDEVVLLLRWDRICIEYSAGCRFTSFIHDPVLYIGDIPPVGIGNFLDEGTETFESTLKKIDEINGGRTIVNSIELKKLFTTIVDNWDYCYEQMHNNLKNADIKDYGPDYVPFSVERFKDHPNDLYIFTGGLMGTKA